MAKPQTGKAGKQRHFPVTTSRSVTPSKIVPIEIRRLMNAHRNSPRMNQAVIDFVNTSGRHLDEETLSLLSKSGFSSCQIPKMATSAEIH